MRGQTSIQPADSLPSNEDQNFHKPIVVIVEDNSDIARSLKRILEEPSKLLDQVVFDVVVANGPIEARPFIDRNSADIFIVDLKLGDPDVIGRISKIIGINLIREISEKTNAGIIVHSSEPEETDGMPAIVVGADDYIEKPATPDKLRSKTLALWRRIQMARPSNAKAFDHANRTFLIGDWKFVVGRREVAHKSGKSVRLSPNEHAFLRYLCVTESHVIDRKTFNTSVLGRPDYEQEMRIDSLVDKIRGKLDRQIEILFQNDRYKLINFQEIKPSLM